MTGGAAEPVQASEPATGTDSVIHTGPSPHITSIPSAGVNEVRRTRSGRASTTATGPDLPELPNLMARTWLWTSSLPRTPLDPRELGLHPPRVRGGRLLLRYAGGTGHRP